MLRMSSWNLNGVRSACQKGFVSWLEGSKFDIVGLQEVRAEPDQIPPELRSLSHWHQIWFPAQKKGYSGTGILSRQAPLRVWKGMEAPEFDCEGRVLTAEFSKVVMITAYFPNSQDKGARLGYKLQFCSRIHQFANDLRKELGKPVVLNGDYNIAHRAIDLARPKENEGNAGYLPEERAWMEKFLSSGWVDTFRALHPDATEQYSWWSARLRARDRNIGWRIDYHTVAEQDRALIVEAGIENQTLGSDHCPVTLTLNL